MSGDTKSRLGGIGSVTKSGRDALDAAEFVVTDTLFCLRGSSRKRQSVTARQGRAPHRFHSLGFAASCVRITAYVNQHFIYADKVLPHDTRFNALVRVTGMQEALLFGRKIENQFNCQYGETIQVSK